MKIKTISCITFLIISCIIVNTPISTKFLNSLQIVVGDVDILEDTAINVSLSFANIQKQNLYPKFLAPVDKPIVLKDFGFKNGEFCTGVYLSSFLNCNVYSIADGEVLEIGFNEQYGNFIKISHGDGYQSFYANLYEIYNLDKVSNGEIIGVLDNTSKLLFEVTFDDELINPNLVVDFYEN